MIKKSASFFVISAIGKLTSSPEALLQREYIKRMAGKLDVFEQNISGNIPINKRLEKEEETLLNSVPEGYRKILLAIDAKQMTSEGWAAKMLQWEINYKGVAFIIGGSDGVSQKMQTLCDEEYSLGKITLPHSLARIVLLEQLYRGSCINSCHPYHK